MLMKNGAGFLSNLKLACNCISGPHFNHIAVNFGLFQATSPVNDANERQFGWQFKLFLRNYPAVVMPGVICCLIPK